MANSFLPRGNHIFLSDRTGNPVTSGAQLPGQSDVVVKSVVVSSGASELQTPVMSLLSPRGRDIVAQCGELSPVSTQQAAQLYVSLREKRQQVAKQIDQLEMEIRSHRGQARSSKATGSTASGDTVQQISLKSAKQQDSEHNRDSESERNSSQPDSRTGLDHDYARKSQPGERMYRFSSTPAETSPRHRYIEQVYDNVSRIHDSIDERVADIKSRCQQLLSRQSCRLSGGRARYPPSQPEPTRRQHSPDVRVNTDNDQCSSSSRLSVPTGLQRSSNSRLLSGMKPLAAANRVGRRCVELWSPGSTTGQ